MIQDFAVPSGLIGRFAVVKLWPEIKTAEDECIARLKIAADALGLECVEVHADGGLLSSPSTKVSSECVDFVLHLHYDTPKQYDAFSIVALWNPLAFYHEWGYDRTSRNLTSHDDFVSCLSEAADDQVTRMVRHSGSHLPPAFRLFHSTADVVHPPSLGDGKLFYAGINWEAISGGKARHQEVLKRLDGTGLLRIYGPTIFQGVRVWAGYSSYVREVPFDGVSMIDEIHRAGIALVLSSQAHKDSGLMSNRLFESIAAGALVICDENPFAARHFGDTLLYIDSRCTEDRIEADIRRHLQWAREHPEEALGMIARAQGILRERFTLGRNLRDLYMGLTERRQALGERQNPAGTGRMRVRLCLVMPEYSVEVLSAHIESVRVQTWRDLSAQLVVDAALEPIIFNLIASAIRDAGAAVEVVPVTFANRSPISGVVTPRKFGAVVLDLLPTATEADAFILVAPNERLHSNHVAVLAGALQRDTNTHCAGTAAVLVDGDKPVHSVHELIDFGFVNRHGPTAHGRFIFRTIGIPTDIGSALRHLQGRPLAALLGKHSLAQQMQASITVDSRAFFPFDAGDEAAENAVIRDFCVDALRLRFGFGPRPRRQAFTQPGEVATSTLGQVLRMSLSPRWLKAQLWLLRREGARARWGVLRRKLGIS